MKIAIHSRLSAITASSFSKDFLDIIFKQIRLSQFFQYNSEFTNEVFSGFGRLCFTLV
ncbi:hypothetical protein BH09BAC3_BH09BAC3_04430 [soil metagenome]